MAARLTFVECSAGGALAVCRTCGFRALRDTRLDAGRAIDAHRAAAHPAAAREAAKKRRRRARGLT